MKHIILRIFILLCFAEGFICSALGQIRQVNIGYRFINPKPEDLFVSPAQIPVSFRFYNYGKDTIYSTDSFTYIISHEILGPYKEVIGRVKVGKTIIPGDSSEVFSDSIGVNWTNDHHTYHFKLFLLCSYFTCDRNNGSPVIRATIDSSQMYPYYILLRHNYSSSVDKLKLPFLPSVSLNPNMLSSGSDGLNIHLQNVDPNVIPSFKLYSVNDQIITVTNVSGSDQNFVVPVNNLLPGVYYLITELNGLRFQNTFVVTN
ncbi:MAG: hypothetical protein GC181_02640 [Bacteroidetes bacterium]|nr:hypothetical protein [Bacteroidota bacterium]